jgi:hypothetical protein
VVARSRARLAASDPS